MSVLTAKAILLELRPEVFEMWCDQHSVEAKPATGFASSGAFTCDRAYGQSRVDSHNEKFHGGAGEVA